MICRDGHSFTQAHYTVLQSSIFVAPYIEVHKNNVRSKIPAKPDSWIKEKHMETFIFKFKHKNSVHSKNPGKPDSWILNGKMVNSLNSQNNNFRKQKMVLDQLFKFKHFMQKVLSDLKVRKSYLNSYSKTFQILMHLL